MNKKKWTDCNFNWNGEKKIKNYFSIFRIKLIRLLFFIKTKNAVYPSLSQMTIKLFQIIGLVTT